MASWSLVPCLVTLRNEYNDVSPGRDKGADGAIGDSNHSSSSDHSIDELSSILDGKDADNIPEVHALDIDSTGPWPGGWAWFNESILDIVENERRDYESPTIVGRLQNVIWNGRIASRTWGWTWRKHTGPDPHTNHAHFSARYGSGSGDQNPENQTRSWGVAEEEDIMATIAELRSAIKAELGEFNKIMGPDGEPTGGTVRGSVGALVTQSSDEKKNIIYREVKPLLDALESRLNEKIDALAKSIPSTKVNK